CGDRGAGGQVGAVREGRGGAGVALDDDSRAGLYEATDAVGSERDSPLAGGGLLGNSNLHSGFGSGCGAKGNEGSGTREAATGRRRVAGEACHPEPRVPAKWADEGPSGSRVRALFR